MSSNVGKGLLLFQYMVGADLSLGLSRMFESALFGKTFIHFISTPDRGQWKTLLTINEHG